MPPRAHLSTGASAVVKLLMLIVSCFAIVLAAAVALAAFSFAYGAREVIRSNADDGVWHRDETGKLVPGPGRGELDTVGMIGGAAGGACALAFLVIAIYLVLRVLRQGAWLTGSVLYIRSVGTRKVDLATATVTGGTSLTAVDPRSGRKVTLPLHSGNDQLSDEQLMLLANAITNTRTRKGDDDPAFAVAQALRKQARDPLS